MSCLRGIEDARASSAFARRNAHRSPPFSSALNLNLHFHALVLDGVFHRTVGEWAPTFRALRAPTTKDIASLVRKIQERVVRLFQRRGVFADDRLPDADEHALIGSYAASAQGRICFGEHAGRLHCRLLDLVPSAIEKKERTANASGFDLHANVAVKAKDRKKLERLCRYILRPPLAQERLLETADGKIAYEMKRRFSDGTTHILFEPLEFIEKLVALIPRPRAHQVLYHGVLAPYAKRRAQIVLMRESSPHPGPQAAKSQSEAQHVRPRRLSWAELLRRGFAIDVLACGECGGRRTIVSAITEPEVIRQILVCVGVPALAPRQHPARAPPQTELCFP